MPDQPVIIQFIHPGSEYQVSRKPKSVSTIPVPWVGGGCSGTCGSSGAGHTRRFVSHEGEYVDGEGKLHTARLGFWTEWEACSTATAMPPAQRGMACAKWVHTLKSPLNPTGEKGINTDPCVFGKSFKYCCCQQSVNGVPKSADVFYTRSQSLIPAGGIGPLFAGVSAQSGAPRKKKREKCAERAPRAPRPGGGARPGCRRRGRRGGGGRALCASA